MPLGLTKVWQKFTQNWTKCGEPIVEQIFAGNLYPSLKIYNVSELVPGMGMIYLNGRLVQPVAILCVWTDWELLEEFACDP